MRGHKQIIDYRKQGLKPSVIVIDAGFRLPVIRTKYDDPDRALELDCIPVVTIEPEEVNAHHDFRFVVGCHVHVRGYTWNDPLYALIERLTQNKPERIVASCIMDNNEVLLWEKGEYRALVS
jgi:hypothetical protein